METRLRGELARLRPLNPFEVLGLAPSASGDAVRAAFLAATKRYHPNLFGRESAEVQELATEVFLVIRRAYALLADDDKRRAQKERLLGGQGPHPALTFAPAAPLSATPPVGVATPPPQRPVAPPRTAPTQPPSGPAPRTPPTQPPSGPAPSRAAAPTPRPMKGVSPPPSKRVGSSTDVQAILDAAKDRGGKFEQANRLIANGRFREARELLQKIAAEDPQNRRYRVRLCYALGLEYRSERKLDEAVREFERAAVLDPENAEVAEQLRKTREVREASRGIISKLFGR